MIGRLLCLLGLHRFPQVCSASMFVMPTCWRRGCEAYTVTRPVEWYPVVLTRRIHP